jgi:O-acetyl-ADP-ribose deacetylase (regulator of RNase III)
MIKEVTGDILLSNAKAVAHGVAPDDHMEHGLALALRERWPSLPKDFRHYCHVHHPKPGSAWTWVNANGVRIVNLMTQEPAPSAHAHGKPGKAKTEYVNHALKELRKIVDDEKIESLALPRLATGVGGLDWNDVKPLVDRHLGDLTIPVYVYVEYQKGVAAPEAS